MPNPYEIYDLLQDYADGVETVREVIIGLVWTYCSNSERSRTLYNSII